MNLEIFLRYSEHLLFSLRRSTVFISGKVNWFIQVSAHKLTLIFNHRISSGILLLTSCLLAFKLPIVIIYFHQLYLGEEILYGPSEKSLTSENFQKPSTPYFLLEGGSIPLEVNCALESVRNLFILIFLQL